MPGGSGQTLRARTECDRAVEMVVHAKGPALNLDNAVSITTVVEGS